MVQRDDQYARGELVGERVGPVRASETFHARVDGVWVVERVEFRARALHLEDFTGDYE